MNATETAVTEFADLVNNKLSMGDTVLKQCDVDSWILTNETLLKLLLSQNVDLAMYDYPNLLDTAADREVAAKDLLVKVKESLGTLTFHNTLSRALDARQKTVLAVDTDHLPPELIKSLSDKVHDRDVVIVGGGSQRHYYAFHDDSLLRMYPKSILPIKPESYPAVLDHKPEPEPVHPLMQKLLARAVK